MVIKESHHQKAIKEPHKPNNLYIIDFIYRATARGYHFVTAGKIIEILWLALRKTLGNPDTDYLVEIFKDIGRKERPNHILGPSTIISIKFNIYIVFVGKPSV